MLQKLSYKPDIQNGVLVGVKRNSIVLSDQPVAGFDNPAELQEYVKVRKIPILVYRDIEGDPEAAAQQYAEYYSNLEDIALLFESGMELKAHHPYPISYGGKLYECIKKHTTQADWTPDVVPAMFSEIQAPAGSGYPEWVQKFAPPYYQIGDRVTYEGKTWVCTAGDANGNNSWAPGVFGWEEVTE